jgi:hypothetical protein
MTTTQAKIDEMTDQVSDIDLAIGRLDQDFEALAAQCDDDQVLRKCEQLESRRHDLLRKKIAIIAASRVLALRQRQEAEQAEQAEKRRQLLEAKKLSDTICALNTRLDAAMQALADLLAQRSNALRALAKSGCIEQTLVNRLNSKSVVTAGVCHAGIASFVALERVANQSFRPLTEGNRVLLGIAKDVDVHPPARPPVERRQLKNGA